MSGRGFSLCYTRFSSVRTTKKLSGKGLLRMKMREIAGLLVGFASVVTIASAVATNPALAVSSTQAQDTASTATVTTDSNTSNDVTGEAVTEATDNSKGEASEVNVPNTGRENRIKIVRVLSCAAVVLTAGIIILSDDHVKKHVILDEGLNEFNFKIR